MSATGVGRRPDRGPSGTGATGAGTGGRDSAIRRRRSRRGRFARWLSGRDGSVDAIRSATSASTSPRARTTATASCAAPAPVTLRRRSRCPVNASARSSRAASTTRAWSTGTVSHRRRERRDCPSSRIGPHVRNLDTRTKSHGAQGGRRPVASTDCRGSEPSRGRRGCGRAARTGRCRGTRELHQRPQDRRRRRAGRQDPQPLRAGARGAGRRPRHAHRSTHPRRPAVPTSPATG